jgi:hypothetical protein
VSALSKDEYAVAPLGADVLSRGDRRADAAPRRTSDRDLQIAPPQVVEVMCECGRPNCTGEITISLHEYDAVRLHPTRFLIKEGHQVADVVRVVGYGAGYAVVAKYEQNGPSVGSL